MADTQNNLLMQAYEVLLRENAWERDAAQCEIITHFDTLLQELRNRPKPKFSLMGWLNNQTQERLLKGIYLWGDVGRGKSMLMDLFYDHIPDSIPARRIHFHAFMTEIHEALHRFREDYPNSDDPLPEIAEEFAEASRILCLDEFQVHDIADAMILSRLFKALLEQGVITIITSNREPDELYEHGLQRESFLPFIALIKERFTTIALDHDTDYRLEKLRDNKTYFQPSTNIEPMEELFDSLTQHPPKSEILHVKGRDLTLPKVADGIVWASFSELCEQPLGAEDYNTLASEYHTLFLTHIPQMNAESRNEAKRFVLLVDALYEHRTRLICSADAPAYDLYPSGDGSFEFQRTVSRLMEMQSNTYLGASHYS